MNGTCSNLENHTEKRKFSQALGKVVSQEKARRKYVSLFFRVLSYVVIGYFVISLKTNLTHGDSQELQGHRSGATR